MDRSIPFDLSPKDLFDILWTQRRLVVLVTVLSVVVTGIATLFVTPEYASAALIRVVPHQVSEANVDDVVEAKYRGPYEIQSFYKSEVRIMRSREVLKRAIAKYQAAGFDNVVFGSPEEGQLTASAVKNATSITPQTNSQLIQIRVQWPDHEQAKALVDAMVEGYIEYTRDQRTNMAAAAKTWLETQLKLQATDIERMKRELRLYQKEQQLVDVEERVTALSAQMQEINTAFAEVSTERILQQTQLATHRQLLAKQNISGSELAQIVQAADNGTLAAEYADAQVEFEQAQRKYLELHPRYGDAKRKVERLEDKLREAAVQSIKVEEAQLLVLQAKERSLKAQVETVKDLLYGKQESLGEYERMVSDLRRAEAFYDKLSKRLDELELTSQTNLSNIFLVDEAIASSQQVSPIWWRNVLMGLLGGLLIGVVVAFLREYIDDTISKPSDVRTYLKVPLVGVAPRVTEMVEPPRALYLVNNPRSPAAEATRVICTVLQFNEGRGLPKRMLVTSAVASEGKTDTSTRLGVTFAERGLKVLLIDCDLRRSQLHKQFGRDRAPGVSDVVKGEVPLDEAIYDSPVPNLSVLFAGHHTSAPSEMLSSDGIQQMLSDCDDRFDLVLVDTSPAAVLSDAIFLARHVQGLVLIVREGKVPRQVIRHTIERLQQVDAPLMGVVLNDVDLRGRRHMRPYYGYSYDYDYDYYTSYRRDPEDEDAEDAVAK